MTKAIELWPVQQRILSELRNSLRYHKRVVLMASTGLGKTQIAIQIIKQALKKEKRVCFVCHRINLVDQTSNALKKQGIRHGIIQGDNPDYYPDRPVQICSIQTLVKREIDKFDIFFFDECHIMFSGHKTILKNNKDAFVVGLSATPMSVGLGKYFSHLVHPVSMKDLIEQKVLKNYEVYGPYQIDLSDVKTIAGEYKKDDLAVAADKPKLTADIVQTWLKLARDKRTIVFCTSVAHGKHLEKEFKKFGISAKEINGYMAKENTKDEIGANQIIEDFRNNKFQVIISVEMLVAGFDVPDISCVVFATSTKSKMKFVQALGRGLRKYDGLDMCTIIDHGGITERLGFPDDIEAEFTHLNDGKHAESKNKKKEKPEKLPKKCPSCDYLKAPGVQKCPACQFKPEFIQDVEVSEGELKKLQRKKRSEYTLEQKQSFLSQLNQHACEKRFKEGKNGCYGWSLMKYKDKFGSDVPSRLDWGSKEPIKEEVKKYIQHLNIAYAKSKNKKVVSFPEELPLKKQCSKCNCGTGLLKQNGPHIQVSCAACETYIKFINEDDIKKGVA